MKHQLQTTHDQELGIQPHISPALLEATDEIVAILTSEFLAQDREQQPKVMNRESRFRGSIPCRNKRARLSCFGGRSGKGYLQAWKRDAISLPRSGSRQTDLLGCPFYFKNRARHRPCLTRHAFLTVKDIEEHLRSSHRQPSFCPRCARTFGTFRARDDHIRSEECELRLLPEFEGITNDQADKLSAPRRRPSSELGQWLDMWKIVFPDWVPPTSPFLTSHEELAVCRLKDFWRLCGRVIVVEVLERKCLQHHLNGIAGEEGEMAWLCETVLGRAADEILALE